MKLAHFEHLFVEKKWASHPRAVELIKGLRPRKVTEIDSYDHFFGKVKRPYLQKRDGHHIFLASKRGQLVKEAPEAYGQKNARHYYYIHAYNCIYECNYCYLQGHFNSPDLVFFLNHEEIMVEIERTINQNRAEGLPAPWFHAGEFSDSLALSHRTNDLPLYYELFKKHSQDSWWELRTKSTQIRPLLSLAPLNNMVVSFSLSPKLSVESNDLLTPGLQQRVLAIKRLQGHGHQVGLHLDPIIYGPEVLERYQELFDQIATEINLDKVVHMSLGVVRFPGKIQREAKKNYPDAEFWGPQLITTDKTMARYPRPLRGWLLSKIKEMAINAGLSKEKIYLCME